MSRAQGYGLDCYCDNKECSRRNVWPNCGSEQYVGEDKAECYRQARAAGWKFSKDRTRDLCPTCARSKVRLV